MFRCKYKVEVGKRIRHFRKRYYLSRETLGSFIGRSGFYIWAIEFGIVFPDLVDLGYLCIEYGLDLNWLIAGDHKF